MIDPVILTLSGTAIGGVIGIAGLLMKSKSDAKHAKAQQRIDRIRSTYEFTLNVVFNMQRDGNPDRTTYGDMFARVSLYGAPEVKRALDRYLAATPSDRKTFDIRELSSAMKAHVDQLEAEGQ